jgi:hypothetical protein
MMEMPDEQMCDCGMMSRMACMAKGGTPDDMDACAEHERHSAKMEEEEMGYVSAFEVVEDAEYEDWGEEDTETVVLAAEYKGKKVTLGKPFRTKGGPKKFAVYVKNDKGNVVMVRFGDPNMEIKRDDPGRRKNFRSRHNCDSPGPRYKARYWSCKMWSKTPVNKMTSEAGIGDCADCGCAGDCGDTVEAKKATDPCQDGYEQFGMKRKNGRLVPNCVPTGSAAKMREEYEEASYIKDEKMVKKSASIMHVMWDLTIEEVGVAIQASTGKSVVVIKGIAFHEGRNKNGWEVSEARARKMVEEMKGVDVTLNHPKPNASGFSRNMAGDIDEATVGQITGGTWEDVESGWNVRYTAEVYRHELFESLTSGMWMKKDYGVSIGGYGVPSEHDPKTGYAKFDEDFTLDHLAIVYKPAYDRANIEEAVRIDVEESAPTKEEDAGWKKEEKEMAASTGFKYPMAHSEEQTGSDTMSEEHANEIEMLRASLEEMKAELVLANSTVDSFKAAEAAAAEEARKALVAEASALGLSGHEDLGADTITSLIASWKAANPEPAPVVMEDVSTPAVASVPSPVTETVVANYLNGVMTETPEAVYERAWNAWASAWNNSRTGTDSAPTYAEARDSLDWLRRA